MSLTEPDLWPSGEPDPLGEDETLEAAPEAQAIEPEAPSDVETPVADTEALAEPPADDTDGDKGADGGTPADEPAGTAAESPTPETQEELTWRKRYEGLMTSRENTRSELERERRQRQELEQSVRQYLESQRQQPQPQQVAPQAPPPPTEQELIAAGFESRQQYDFLMDRARQAAEAGVMPQLQQVQQSQAQIAQQLAAERAQAQRYQQQQQTEAELNATRQAVAQFGQVHPEFVGDEPEAQALRSDFDMVVEKWNKAWESTGAGIFDPADLPSLEVAAEAVRNPALAEVLALYPTLFESEEGLRMARIQAAQFAPATPAKSKVDTKAVDAALAAAHTEPGTSGPAKSAGSQKDEFDEALDEWNQDRQRSVF